MAWDEFSVVFEREEFVRKAKRGAIPVPLESYLAAARATSREIADMGADEAGTCFPWRTAAIASALTQMIESNDVGLRLPRDWAHRPRTEIRP
jgi:hypothetical protein